MYIHMFAFRWKPGVTEEQKLKVRVEIRNLQGQILGSWKPGSAPTYRPGHSAMSWEG